MQETLPRRFAPEIFRKRMLIEGYFGRPALDAAAIRPAALALVLWWIWSR
ncbi:MAG: hypothetical protein QOF98_2104 [Streptomyces sp.]|nr:hypothetical protein [Streptomyces sp.]